MMRTEAIQLPWALGQLKCQLLFTCHLLQFLLVDSRERVQESIIFQNSGAYYILTTDTSKSILQSMSICTILVITVQKGYFQIGNTSTMPCPQFIYFLFVSPLPFLIVFVGFRINRDVPHFFTSCFLCLMYESELLLNGLLCILPF